MIEKAESVRKFGISRRIIAKLSLIAQAKDKFCLIGLAFGLIAIRISRFAASNFGSVPTLLRLSSVGRAADC